MLVVNKHVLFIKKKKKHNNDDDRSWWSNKTYKILLYVNYIFFIDKKTELYIDKTVLIKSFLSYIPQVVLSACSSYFQSLFLDHPSRHPIVILKDVHFSELRTLVEFMYKGEVNVQYCQLSALLKTAESLKV